MSFKKFSTAQDAPANAKVEETPKTAAPSDRPSVQPGEMPSKAAPKPKS